MESKKTICKPIYISSFSGTTSENVATFLKKYNRAIVINGWTEDDKAHFLVALLEGSALQIFENNECNATVSTNWPTLERKLGAEFEQIAQTDMLRLLL